MLGCLLITVLLLGASLSWGSVRIPLADVWATVAGGMAEKASWSQIVLQFRLPKALTALLAGAALSVSGLQMQTLFRNPLAGPFVLGISSGASLGVALLLMGGFLFTGVWSQFGGGWIALAASLGSGSVFLLVMIVSLRIRDTMTLLIIGLMIGSASSAVVSIIQYFSRAEQIQAYLIWTFGSLGGLSWSELAILAPIVIAGLIMALALIKPLDALLLGEHYARSLGVRIGWVRLGIIVSTALLAGSVTAFCGPIAFLGLAVPHLARLLLGTNRHALVLPASLLLGMWLLLLCDLIAQLPGQDTTLPINAVTALFGAPMVIWLIVRKPYLNKVF